MGGQRVLLSAAEMQLVYSISPADWAYSVRVKRHRKKKKWKEAEKKKKWKLTFFCIFFIFWISLHFKETVQRWRDGNEFVRKEKSDLRLQKYTTHSIQIATSLLTIHKTRMTLHDIQDDERKICCLTNPSLPLMWERFTKLIPTAWTFSKLSDLCGNF